MVRGEFMNEFRCAKVIEGPEGPLVKVGFAAFKIIPPPSIRADDAADWFASAMRGGGGNSLSSGETMGE